MGEGGGGVEAEHRAGTLQRVQRAEDAVDQRRVFRIVLEIEQVALELVQEVLGLEPEDVGRRCGAHAPRTLLTIDTSCSGRKGLMIQPEAPADLACCFIPSSDSVVRQRIGIPSKAGSLRSAPTSSMPFMCGMLTSVMTAWIGPPPWALVSASRPSAASIT